MESLEHCVSLIDNLLLKISTDQAQTRNQGESTKTTKSGKVVQPSSTASKKQKTKSDKKAGKEQQSQPDIPPQHEYFVKAKLRIAKVVQVEEIDGSDKLFKCQIELGDEKRQVAAGLKKYLTVEELLNKHVVCVCNLKAAKLAGETSEAMIMASETEVGGEVIVKPLVPPEDSQAGDVVFVEDLKLDGLFVKQMKSDHWKRVMENLRVNAGKACHAGAPLATKNGPITLPDMVPDGAIIK
eukprot:TRINITY_DN3142_c0_g3_i1.p1 TRINITY_DN3142_c0_g3~~TRINITY_DN3142_c0_g3_i1.p1  ORF type:complete len:240 (-),score=31.89 TRINITY_DN3142_c0_g3_i1:254-973(-)